MLQNQVSNEKEIKNVVFSEEQNMSGSDAYTSSDEQERLTDDEYFDMSDPFKQKLQIKQNIKNKKKVLKVIQKCYNRTKKKYNKHVRRELLKSFQAIIDAKEKEIERMQFQQQKSSEDLSFNYFTLNDWMTRHTTSSQVEQVGSNYWSSTVVQLLDYLADPSI